MPDLGPLSLYGLPSGGFLTAFCNGLGSQDGPTQKAIWMGMDYLYRPGATSNQLRSWSHDYAQSAVDGGDFMWLASTSPANVGRKAANARLQPLEHSRGFEDLRAGANSIW
jgi:hypothetical protein